MAVIAASDTLGVGQTGPGKAILIVDARANSSQRDALIRLAKSQGGDLIANVIGVQNAEIDLQMCPCKSDACAILHAGDARIQTRCLEEHVDKICGNESAFYPPLAKNVKVRAALAVENAYTGKGINETWKESGRRSAYVGSFEIR